MVGTSSGDGCPSSCYNPLNPPASKEGNVLNDFPLHIQTLGQAMTELAQALKSAIPANNIIVKSNSLANYTLDIRINSKTTASATIRFTNTNGDFPVVGSYTKGASTGNASFSSLADLLDWLAYSLR